MDGWMGTFRDAVDGKVVDPMEKVRKMRIYGSFAFGVWIEDQCSWGAESCKRRWKIRILRTFVSFAGRRSATPIPVVAGWYIRGVHTGQNNPSESTLNSTDSNIYERRASC